MGVCLSCGGELQPSVTRGSVQKYLQLGLRLSQKYDVGEYLRSRFVLASEELATLFVPEGHQGDINDYFSTDTKSMAEASAKETPSLAPTGVTTDVIIQLSKLDQEEEEEKKSHKKAKPGKAVEQYQTTLF